MEERRGGDGGGRGEEGVEEEGEESGACSIVLDR